MKRIVLFVRKIAKKIIKSVLELPFITIKNNKIVFDNFNGKGYGCNPKYIAEEIIRQGLPYDLVWLVSNLNEEMPKQIRKIRYGSIKALYELATAKVWIDNVRNYKGINKKKKQFYIQTWHGGIGLKAIEKDVEDLLSQQYVKEAKNDGKIMDLLLTDNKRQAEYMKKNFWYNGEIMCNGIPRESILLNPTKDVRDKVHKYFKIEENTKIALYVPTFRNDTNLSIYKFNYEECCKKLEEKFNEKYVMLIRLHPNIANYDNEFQYNKKVINATNYPDIEELISACDVGISDYSGVAFEIGIIDKPVFLIAKDFKEYLNSERKFTYQLDEIPFDYNENEKQLFSCIENFDIEVYHKKLNTFYHNIGLVKNPNIAKDIVEIIKRRVAE